MIAKVNTTSVMLNRAQLPNAHFAITTDSTRMNTSVISIAWVIILRLHCSKSSTSFSWLTVLYVSTLDTEDVDGFHPNNGRGSDGSNRMRAEPGRKALAPR